MAVDLEPSTLEEDDEEEEAAAAVEEDAPAHHPVAPADDLFDISTTVDPSYIISLIRKLLPTNNLERNIHSNGVDSTEKETSELNTDSMEEREALPLKSSVDESDRMDIVDNYDNFTNQEGNGNENVGWKTEGCSATAGEGAWEEYGCILWDLAASRTHAELMVQNLILDVLLANLMVSESARIREICLGIIGNIACHEVLMKTITSTVGLIEIIVNQLFSDDTQCLCEACRLLTLGLQGSESVTWAKSLLPDHILRRLVWIAENTLNPSLIEKSVGLLLTIIESQSEAAAALLSPLTELGLSNLLVNLLAYEMNKLMSERMPERYPALDIILRAAEALSIYNEHSQEISSNEELIQLVCDLIKLSDKAEIAESCVTAMVLLANILSDVPALSSEISQDLLFLQGLLDIMPFTSNDIEARNALWSVLARLLLQIQESKLDWPSLSNYISALVSKSDLIEEDLLSNQQDPSNVHETLNASGTKSTTTALKRITSILNQWIAFKDNDVNDESAEHLVKEKDVNRLLKCCQRYTTYFMDTLMLSTVWLLLVLFSSYFFVLFYSLMVISIFLWQMMIHAFIYGAKPITKC